MIFSNKSFKKVLYSISWFYLFNEHFSSASYFLLNNSSPFSLLHYLLSGSPVCHIPGTLLSAALPSVSDFYIVPTCFLSLYLQSLYLLQLCRPSTLEFRPGCKPGKLYVGNLLKTLLGPQCCVYVAVYIAPSTEFIAPALLLAECYKSLHSVHVPMIL
jgi:hypothetical protein